MVFIRILAIIALIGSVAWMVFEPGFEPLLAIVGSVSGLISTFLIERQIARKAQQKQSVSKSSVGIQAGGDVNIGKVRDSKDAK